METKEFHIFRSLLTDVYTKAFGESLAPLPHAKAQSLSWFIYEATGEVLSYKTLSNYVHAVLDQAPARINPNVATLAILLRYVQGAAPVNPAVAWFQFRSQALRRLGPALECAA